MIDLTTINPANVVSRGLDLSGKIDTLKANRSAQQLALMQAQQKLGQGQVAAAQNQQVIDLINKPNKTMQDLEHLSLIGGKDMVPGIKLALEGTSSRAKEAKIGQYNMLKNAAANNPDVFKNMMEEQIRLAQDKGDEAGATQGKKILQAYDMDPDFVQSVFDDAILLVQDPAKFTTNQISLLEERRKGEMHPLDVEKKQVDIEKTIEDTEMSKLDKKLKVIDSRLKHVKDEREQEKLELDKAKFEEQKLKLQREREITKAEADTTYNARIVGLENTKIALDSLLDPVNKEAVAGVVGMIEGRLPTLKESSRNAEAMIDNLKSNMFMESIQAMRGMGALSNAEGLKVEQAVASLDQKQSFEGLKSQLNRIRDHVMKLEQVHAREYQQKYGTPPPTSVQWNQNKAIDFNSGKPIVPEPKTIDNVKGVEDMLNKYGY